MPKPSIAIPFPVALGASVVPGVDPSSAAALLGKTVAVTPVVHPALAALLDDLGATRRGFRSWSVGLGKDFDLTPFAAAFDALPAGLIYADTAAAQAEKNGAYGSVNRATVPRELDRALSGRAGSLLTRARRMRLANGQHPVAAKNMAVLLSASDTQMYLKVVTAGFGVDAPLEQDEYVSLDLLRAETRTDPLLLSATEAVDVLERAAATGLPVLDRGNGEMATLRRTLAGSISVTPVRGRPALANVHVGRWLRVSGLGTSPAGRSTHTITRTAGEAAAVIEAVENVAGVTLAVDPHVADVGAMATADPTRFPALRPYQNQAVGVHQATSLGYVSALAPGLGKTVTSLVGMRMRAETRPGYRALVAVPAAIRTQWAAETGRWFPEAQVVVLRTRRDADQLAETLQGAADTPVVVVASYEMIAGVTDLTDQVAADDTFPDLATLVGYRAEVRNLEVAEVAAPAADTTTGPTTDTADTADTADTPADPAADAVAAEPAKPAAAPIADTLVSYTWDDLICDEAALVLRSTGSKRSKALWTLRSLSEVALALTGTPIDRSLDDLGRLVSWVRDDPTLFLGTRLDRSFDMTDPEQMRAFADAIGPLVFRRDRSEVADELPEIVTEVVVLDPTDAELRLAQAARSELRRIYTELMERLEEATALNPDDPRYAEAQEELREARGAVLGGVTLARMAASDPSAVDASNSSAAALLKSRGLVQAAVKAGGTKRALVVGMVADLIQRGEKVLLFTDFSSVAVDYVADLTALGVRAATVTGGQSNNARDAAVDGFQNGDIAALVCTAAAREGLNLQRATALVHIDLPWLPSQVVQRQARANRIGAAAQTLQILIPIMAGTIEERVVSRLVSRAGTAMAALDTVRGVNAAETEIGLALGGLAANVKDSELTASEHGLLAMTRDILAA